jgi:hypothetical protein
MPSVTGELRNVAGTEAALGWAGTHTLVVDRPEGRAGGHGLGFNGAQLLHEGRMLLPQPLAHENRERLSLLCLTYLPATKLFRNLSSPTHDTSARSAVTD